MIEGLKEKFSPFDKSEQKIKYMVRCFHYGCLNDKDKQYKRQGLKLGDCTIETEGDDDPVSLFFEAIKELSAEIDKKYARNYKPYLVQRHENSITIRRKEQTLEEGHEVISFDLILIDREITLRRKEGSNDWL